MIFKRYVAQRQGLDGICNGFAICFKVKQYFGCSICKKVYVFKVLKWVKLSVDNGKTEGLQIILSDLLKNNVLYFKLYRYSKALNTLRSTCKNITIFLYHTLFYPNPS